MNPVIKAVQLPGASSEGGLAARAGDVGNAILGSMKSHYDTKLGTREKRLDGTENIGVLDSLGAALSGSTPESRSGVYQEGKDRANEKKFKPALQAYDVPWVAGLDEGTYTRQLLEGQEARGDARRTKLRNEAYMDPFAVDERAASRLSATRSHELAERGYGLQEDKLTEQGRQFDVSGIRADKRSASDSMLAIKLAEMQQAADTKRYEQDRMYYEQDKRDAALQALVGGLFNLGGAFVL